ncbi:hypothetical protein PFFVO_01467 [Plasmodium falciparum Vietnam Oak-Knoll (FVO)]|uniref:RNA polymerase sigma-70 region 3 domain-containing protein n=1 Tax=Plasmodium falciparum Vietnam Oak-Knoll (FVO) TaxID=1036723 RepID=A0A024VA30_PLAFA|nr:hypothetical protein PFFVO_01467 [Plasmodium falciparum Vietnam Oak-Knoll (FVO)]
MIYSIKYHLLCFLETLKIIILNIRIKKEKGQKNKRNNNKIINNICILFKYVWVLGLLLCHKDIWIVHSYHIKNDRTRKNSYNFLKPIKYDLFTHKKNVYTSNKHNKKKTILETFKGIIKKKYNIGSRVKEDYYDNIVENKNKISKKDVSKEINKNNNYFNNLCYSDMINKTVDEHVNFDDGIINYFVLNSNPNLSFLLNSNEKGKKIYTVNIKNKKNVSEDLENYDNKSEEETTIKNEHSKNNNNSKNNINNNSKNNINNKCKIKLKLKRGYMNEIYEREKKKLSIILSTLKDKSIFKKKKNKMKETILLLNGQTVKTEVIKQYLFHKLRLEYYESIRDQKKILTLDLWSKEINMSVENLKKLIVYIYKMKNLVQKEDEDLLIKTYFYNKTNMFTLFRNNYTDNDIPLDYDLLEKKEDTKNNNENNISHEILDDQDPSPNLINDKKNKKNRKKNNVQNDYDVNTPNNLKENDNILKRDHNTNNNNKNNENNYDIFMDYFDNAEKVLYNDCENLINVEVQKFMECIKDIVFFENSIYLIEKLENRPPLLEELTYAYNYDKDIFLKKLENKIKLSQKLLIYFIPLINSTVKRIEANFSSNLSEDDFLLVSLDAVKNGFKKYDVEKLGIKNLTKYVYIWAKNSTYNYYQKHKSFISISPHTYSEYNKIKKFEDSFLEKHNRKPNIKEISEGLNLSEERVEKALTSFVNIIDAEKPIVYHNNKSGNEEKNTYKDLIVNSDDIHSFNEIMYNDIVIKALRTFICKGLKKKINKLIIFMKFGLFLKKKIYTDEEICEILKISKKKFQKQFEDSLNEIKKYITKIKSNKSQLDTNFDFASYLNLTQYDFLGNDFSQIDI